MAKKTYVGVNNVARNVSKMYVGVNGVARRVKKAYVGVNGAAKLIFALIPTGVRKLSTPLQLGVLVDQTSSAKTTNHVFFMGGETIITAQTIQASSNVTVFDKAHVSQTLTIQGTASALVEGFSQGGYSFCNTADATLNYFDDSLTRRTMSITRQQFGMPTAHAGNYLILPISNASYSGAGTTVAMSSSLTLTNVTNLSSAVSYDPESATTRPNGNAAFFGCKTTTLRQYDSGLTYSARSLPSGVPTRRQATGTIGSEYTIAIGGDSGDYGFDYSSGVTINSSDTTSSSVNLGSTRSALSGSSLGEFFLVGGGLYDSVQSKSDMWKFNKNLTRSTVTSLSSGGAYCYGFIEFNDKLYAPNGRTFLASGGTAVDNYNTGYVDVYELTY